MYDQLSQRSKNLVQALTRLITLVCFRLAAVSPNSAPLAKSPLAQTPDTKIEKRIEKSRVRRHAPPPVNNTDSITQQLRRILNRLDKPCAPNGAVCVPGPPGPPGRLDKPCAPNGVQRSKRTEWQVGWSRTSRYYGPTRTCWQARYHGTCRRERSSGRERQCRPARNAGTQGRPRGVPRLSWRHRRSFITHG